MNEFARAIFGIIIIVLPVLCLLLYLPILLIFFVDREYRKASAYIIMTHIGVLDVLQLMVHSYSGVLVFVNASIDNGVNKVMGAFLTGLWYSMLAFTLLLTINRLFTILLQRWIPCLASNRLNYVLYTLCYVSFLAPFVLKLLPHCNYVFNPETFSWSYPPTDSEISLVMINLGNYLVLVIVVMSVATYVSIFSYISFFSNTKLSKREYRITIQVSLFIGYFLFSFVYWTYLMPLFGKSVVADFISCLVWVLMNGINPAIYLIFNEKLRNSCVTLFSHLKISSDASGHNRTVIVPVKSKIFDRSR